MITHLEQGLVDLRIRVLEMAAYVDKSLEKSLKALSEIDADLAQEVIEGDAHINRMECDIDAESLRLLALAQPVAGDLRAIVGYMRIVVNLERAGDQAVNIAERVLMLSAKEPLSYDSKLDELGGYSLKMYRSAVKSIQEEDPALAARVCSMDSRADDLDLQIMKGNIDHMIGESRAIERCVHRIIISRCLERVGDLSTNIAECTMFMIEGVELKHHCGGEDYGL